MTLKVIYTKLVGVSFHQEKVKKLEENQQLYLVRQPTNQYDKNAIAVAGKEGKVGFIKKDLAEQLAPIIDSGVKMVCKVKHLTGTDKATTGVNIKIKYDWTDPEVQEENKKYHVEEI